MMIEVNLLPQELRRIEHTPLPRFLIIIMGTTLVSIALALGAIVHMRNLPDLARADQALTDEVMAAAQSQREHDQLLGQIDEVKQRKLAIAEIWRARIIWSRKLDQLSQMIPKFIGLEKLTLEESRSAGAGNETGGYLNLESVCAGADVDRLAMFRRILRGDYPAKEGQDTWLGRTWFEDFDNIEATPWVRKDMAAYVEKEALNFTLKLAIKTDAQRLKEYLERTAQEDAMAKSAQAEQTQPAPVAANVTPVSVKVLSVTPSVGDTATPVNASGRTDQ